MSSFGVQVRVYSQDKPWLNGDESAECMLPTKYSTQRAANRRTTILFCAGTMYKYIAYSLSMPPPSPPKKPCPQIQWNTGFGTAPRSARAVCAFAYMPISSPPSSSSAVDSPILWQTCSLLLNMGPLSLPTNRVNGPQPDYITYGTFAKIRCKFPV